MIVCSCNVLTAAQILATLETEEAGTPRSPAQAYRCLGCAPNCGRCLVTVRELLREARGGGSTCDIGCPTCPGHHQPVEEEPVPFLMAAE